MNIKGFTLLELIVVLIVLASLVAIALPQYTNFVEKSRVAEVMQLLGAIKSAEEANYILTNKYSAVLTDLGLAYIEDNPRWRVVGYLAPGGVQFEFAFERKNTEGCPLDQVGKTVWMTYNRNTGRTRYGGTHIGAPWDWAP